MMERSPSEAAQDWGRAMQEAFIKGFQAAEHLLKEIKKAIREEMGELIISYRELNKQRVHARLRHLLMRRKYPDRIARFIEGMTID